MYCSNIFNQFRISISDVSSLYGNVFLYHDKKSDGNYAYCEEKIVVNAKIPRSLLAFNVSLVVIEGYKNENVCEIKGLKKGFDLYFDDFCFNLNEIRCAGLYFYYFKIDAGITLYGYRPKNNVISFSFEIPNEENLYQITLTEKPLEKQEIIPGIMYHIFVDRFFRSGNIEVKKSAILIENWNSEIPEYPEYPGAFLKNNTFFGGNIYGIIEKLDYLKSLGVSLIYLSPIFESPSNHKYDTADYEQIDKMFGGENALDELIKKAKEMNIGIILDGVFNHTGADSKYFNKYGNYKTIGAFQSKASPYYDWFSFESFPDKYECWWGIDILPRIFYNSNNAENYFLGEGGVVERWIKRGIRGFRLDVADELSDNFIKRMRALISNYNKSALLYGEVWEDASNKIAYGKRKKYYLGSELTGVMNYPLRKGINSYIRKKDKAEIEFALNTVIFNMPKNIRNTAMNIMGSHDTERIITALGGISPDGKSNRELSTLNMSEQEYKIARRRVMSAYTIIASLPGIPTVYYGDEVGLEGYSDPFNRKTFPWGREDCEILSHYKATGILRLNNDAFFDGEFYLLYLDDNFLVTERKKEKERFITVYNNTEKDEAICFSETVENVYNGYNAKKFVLNPETAYIFKTTSQIEFEIGC